MRALKTAMRALKTGLCIINKGSSLISIQELPYMKTTTLGLKLVYSFVNLFHNFFTCDLCKKFLNYQNLQCHIQMYFGTVWTVEYRRQKNTPKKPLVTFFRYKFQVKTKLNINYENLKTKIFSRVTNILPQIQWTSNIFGYSVTTIGHH